MPNTLGVISLFVVFFAVALAWATHGHTADAHGQMEDPAHSGPPPAHGE